MRSASALLVAHASESDGDQLLHHLLMDYAIKVVIVVAALILLVTGMIVLWKKVGRSPEERHGHESPR